MPTSADFPTDLRALEPEYELIREIGQGGMAAVYLGRHRASGRLVAIKAIRARYLDDPEALRRFAREAHTVAGLDHPHIVRTEAVEQIDDRAIAIIMEHIPGGTVRDRLRERGAFGAEEAETVLRDVASALGYAHRRGIVHRDVKPENIFLDENRRRAVLSDFGIARRIDGDPGITQLGGALGTPQYMSPEQIDGAVVDGRSDVYSLGVLGWELLTGKRPWAGESLYGVIYKQKHENLPRITSLRPRVPANLLFAIEGALEKDREKRWQSVDEFIDRLTYDPPPLLAQSYPPGASRAIDAPTVRFRVPIRPEPDTNAVQADGPDVVEQPVMDASVLPAPVLPAPVRAPVVSAVRHPSPAFRVRSPAPEDQNEVETAADYALPDFTPPQEEVVPTSRGRRALALLAPLAFVGASVLVALNGGTRGDRGQPPTLAAAGDGRRLVSGGETATDSTRIRLAGADRRQLEGAAPRMADSAHAGGRDLASDYYIDDDPEPAGVAPAAPRVNRSAGTVGPAARPAGAAGARRRSEPVRGQEASLPAVDSTTVLDASAVSADPPIENPFAIPDRDTGTSAKTEASSALAASRPPPPSGPSPRCRVAATADQRACLETYVTIADAPMARAFDALVAELRKVAGTPPDDPDPATVRRIRFEQRVWLGVREKECPRTPDAAAGPFWAEARSRCFADMAEARGEELLAAVRRLRRR